MNLLLCVNDKYLDKACTLLYSIRKYNKESCVVYLMNTSFSTEQINEFKSFLENQCKYQLELVEVDNNIFGNLPIGDMHFSVEMYYRIIAQFILPSNVDRVLWLDADIVTLSSIEEFYNQDFVGKSIIACADKNYNSVEVKKIKERLRLPVEHVYFNSGVLLLNLRKLRESTTLDGVMGVANQLADVLTYPDQDILNCLYSEDVLYADERQYNYQVLQERKLQLNESKNVAILHYAGKWKPWDYRYITPVSVYYWRIMIERKKYWELVRTLSIHFIWKIYQFFRK